MRVALAHDYIKEFGGAERVLEVLHEIFPQAPIFTAYYNPTQLGSHGERIAKWDIRPSWFQHFPFASKLISPFRLFAPLMFESFDLSGYDLVISSSSAAYLAKAVLTKPSTLHISYIHTPPRYLYGYATSFNYKKHWWTRILGEFANHFLRIYDFETSQRPDILVANSKNIQERIKKFYRRESVVIYPPVDVVSIENQVRKMRPKKGDYFLALNRLVRGKGTETIVTACTRLNLPLKVIGSGPELKNLKKIAGKSVQFLGHVNDWERIKLLAEAKALIVASEDEDFGITAVEAQAAGTPVVAIKQGGFMETVSEGKTGIFFAPSQPPPDYKRYVDPETVDNLIEVLKSFDENKFDQKVLQKNAERFSKENFKKAILNLIEKNLKK